ncbi:hypothetical protein L6164_013518 [Bauhinia variegata]|uniref:Uncharacterized protein n=1 Tax=Bauhinia variegata TaxID=167791 RepID=A0ACB9NEF4_BAUVA|nr:hypothetical protein L6164_013518 [Bauhinia variegata]
MNRKGTNEVDEEPSHKGAMPKLPSELITEILIRLPVKSLCRFRCVCKRWRSLISDPHFVKLHLDRAERKRLILGSYSLHSVDCEPPLDDRVVAEQLDFPLKENLNLNDNYVEIFGSSNGLLCIMPKPKRFFVFNPTTGESREIPFLSVAPPSDTNVNQSNLFGFGYAPSVDDYKFVRVSYGCITNVFSLRTNLWKTVQEKFDYDLSGSLSLGTYLHGSVHWVARINEGPVVIVAFDLSEEKFKELPLPAAIPNFDLFNVGVLRGCLCLLHSSGLSIHHEFWLMNEYGMKDSWRQILIAEPYSFLKPLCYWKTNKILMAKDLTQLVLCHPKDGTCKDFMVEGMPIEFHADLYVESLVSPNFFVGT